MGRGGYARAPRTAFSGNPRIGHGTASPVRPGHAVTVEYRVNGGPVRQAIGKPPARPRCERAGISGAPAGPIRRNGGVSAGASLCRPADLSAPTGVRRMSPVSGGLRSGTGPDRCSICRRASLGLGYTFLWAGTVAVRKEVIGVMPDGLRINWHVTGGRFVGPRFEGTVRPGGANWLRIRKDGVGIVNVTECLETRSGARIDCLYDGILDLGAAGYARAISGDFGILPPFVLAPTYATAEKDLAWLNRAQCIGVGRVDMKALRASYDIYVVTAGAAKHVE